MDPLDFIEPDPEFLSRYEVDGVLGHGAMGVVVRAKRRADGRAVAIKLLREFAPDHAAPRMEREQELMLRLKHPHVVELLEVGRLRDDPYLVLELVEGGTLGTRVRAERIAPAEALRIARELLRGLTACHEHGIVHRDLKPDNVLFDRDGHVKIADLGLARAVDSRTLTEPGCMVGTPRYMAPEVLRGEKASPAADVYAAAAILYEMLAGRPAFEGESVVVLMRKVLVEEPAPLTALCPDVPPALAAAVHAALSKDPRARPQSARAFADALPAEPRPRRKASPKAPRAAPPLAVLAGAGLLALATVALRTPAPPVAPPLPEPAPVRVAPADAAARLDAIDREADWVRWRADIEALDGFLITQELDRLGELTRTLRRRYDDLLARARELARAVAGGSPVMRLRVAGCVAMLSVRNRYLASRMLGTGRAADPLRGLPAARAAAASEVQEVEEAAALIEPALRSLAGRRPVPEELRFVLDATGAVGDATRELMTAHRDRARALTERLEAALLAVPDPEAGALTDLVMAVFANSPAAGRDATSRARLTRGQAALRRLLPLAAPALRPALEQRALELGQALR